MNATPATVHPRPKGKAPTIHDIKHAQPSDCHFFDRASMRFFGQTMRSFSVSWNETHGTWQTTAGMWDRSGRFMGTSVHLWEVGTLRHIGTPGVMEARKAGIV